MEFLGTGLFLCLAALPIGFDAVRKRGILYNNRNNPLARKLSKQKNGLEVNMICMIS